MAAVPFPAFEPHPEVWLLVGLFGAALRDRGRTCRPAARAGEDRGGHAACRSCASRRGRSRSWWPPTGRSTISARATCSRCTWPSTSCTRSSPRRCCCSARPRGWRALLLSPPGVAALGALAGPVPARDDPLQPRRDRHAHPVRRRCCAAQRARSTSRCTRWCSAPRWWCGCRCASPLPEVPRLAPLLRMLFLFLQSVVPTIPASFLTFGDHPLYPFYERVPRLYDGLSAMEDMRIAGLDHEDRRRRRCCGSSSLSSSSAGTTPRSSAVRRRGFRATSIVS